MQAVDYRQERGQAIAKLDNQIRRLDEHTYTVQSQSGNGVYTIMSTELGWLCECPDHMYRDVKCKHLWAVEISLALRKKVESSVIIQPISVKSCPKCRSESIKRHGIRHNKHADLQKFQCKDCGYWFTVNLGFEGMRATPQIITSAMQLYFTGESFRGVRNFLKLQGVKFSHQAVYNWVEKYTELMEGYLDQIRPQLGDTWRTDELYVKVKGNMKYLFAMMDDETRFRIAQMVSEHKGTDDVRPMFRESIERAEKKPKTLISDGAHNFHDAYRKEFWDTYGENPSPVHIKEIRLDGQVHNNKMERQNGEWRDREKVMRSLKRDDSPVIAGMQIFHNYIRPHMGLPNEITPAEAAGIKIEGTNKWQTIIQNASKRS
ncbi:MAG: DDE-type integrase/transposase/recombinase [Thaumarchaeota archaeon]|nr:DDE-type integrase/transposase/recombinase [Nitrososphaerota archaeon]